MAALAKKEAFGEAVIRKALSVVASGRVFCWALIGIPFFFLFLACFSRTCCSLVWRALCPLQGGLRARRPAMSYGDCWVARVKWWVSFVPFFFFLFCTSRPLRKTKKCERYGILYGQLQLRHSMEGSIAWRLCRGGFSSLFFRETSIIGTLCYSYLEFFAQRSSFFHGHVLASWSLPFRVSAFLYVL